MIAIIKAVTAPILVGAAIALVVLLPKADPGEATRAQLEINRQHKAKTTGRDGAYSVSNRDNFLTPGVEPELPPATPDASQPYLRPSFVD